MVINDNKAYFKLNENMFIENEGLVFVDKEADKSPSDKVWFNEKGSIFGPSYKIIASSFFINDIIPLVIFIDDKLDKINLKDLKDLYLDVDKITIDNILSYKLKTNQYNQIIYK